MGLRENREAGAHQLVRSENKTLREEEKEKIKGRDERSLYTRWPKSSPGLDFGRSLTRHGPDPASLDSTASKGAAATASKGAPATVLYISTSLHHSGDLRSLGDLPFGISPPNPGLIASA